MTPDCLAKPADSTQAQLPAFLTPTRDRERREWNVDDPFLVVRHRLSDRTGGQGATPKLHNLVHLGRDLQHLRLCRGAGHGRQTPQLTRGGRSRRILRRSVKPHQIIGRDLIPVELGRFDHRPMKPGRDRSVAGPLVHLICRNQPRSREPVANSTGHRCRHLGSGWPQADEVFDCQNGGHGGQIMDVSSICQLWATLSWIKLPQPGSLGA